MLAQIAQVSANFGFRAPEKPYPLETFMPRSGADEEEAEAVQQEYVAATFRSYLMTCKAINEKGNETRVVVPPGSTPQKEIEKIWASTSQV